MTDHEKVVYYNAIGRNTELKAVPIEYSAQLQSPIVEKSSEYQCSCIKFQIPGNLIPLFVFQPEQYKVAMTFGVTSIVENVVYVPNRDLYNLTTSDPQYYYIYDYQPMINMINTALKTCYDALLIAEPTFGASIAPWIVYDEPTQTFALYGEETFWSDDPIDALTTAKLWFNSQLWGFFRNFQFQFYWTLGNPITPSSTQNWVELPIIGDTNNYEAKAIPPYFLYGPTPTAVNVVVNRQTYQNLVSWVDIRSVIITSGTLNNRSEFYQPSGAYNSIPIIAEFTVSSVNGFDYRSGIVYNPTAEFRYFNLMSDGPLTLVNLNVYWVTRTGTQLPVYLEYQSDYTIKLMFVKKPKNGEQMSGK